MTLPHLVFAPAGYPAGSHLHVRWIRALLVVVLGTCPVWAADPPATDPLSPLTKAIITQHAAAPGVSAQAAFSSALLDKAKAAILQSVNDDLRHELIRQAYERAYLRDQVDTIRLRLDFWCSYALLATAGLIVLFYRWLQRAPTSSQARPSATAMADDAYQATELVSPSSEPRTGRIGGTTRLTVTVRDPATQRVTSMGDIRTITRVTGKRTATVRTSAAAKPANVAGSAATVATPLPEPRPAANPMTAHPALQPLIRDPHPASSPARRAVVRPSGETAPPAPPGRGEGPGPRNAGMTLIEVIIAIAILGTVLAMAASGIFSLDRAQTAQRYKAIVELVVHNLADRITGADWNNLGHYDITPGNIQHGAWSWTRRITPAGYNASGTPIPPLLGPMVDDPTAPATQNIYTLGLLTNPSTSDQQVHVPNLKLYLEYYAEGAIINLFNPPGGSSPLSEWKNQINPTRLRPARAAYYSQWILPEDPEQMNLSSSTATLPVNPISLTAVTARIIVTWTSPEGGSEEYDLTLTDGIDPMSSLPRFGSSVRMPPRQAFTLLEVLIASALFATFSVVAIQSMLTSSHYSASSGGHGDLEPEAMKLVRTLQNDFANAYFVTNLVPPPSGGYPAAVPLPLIVPAHGSLSSGGMLPASMTTNPSIYGNAIIFIKIRTDDTLTPSSEAGYDYPDQIQFDVPAGGVPQDPVITMDHYYQGVAVDNLIINTPSYDPVHSGTAGSISWALPVWECSVSGQNAVTMNTLNNSNPTDHNHPIVYCYVTQLDPATGEGALNRYYNTIGCIDPSSLGDPAIWTFDATVCKDVASAVFWHGAAIADGGTVPRIWGDDYSATDLTSFQIRIVAKLERNGFGSGAPADIANPITESRDIVATFAIRGE